MPTADPQDPPIVVWTYADAGEFADHAREMGDRGYRVAGQTTGSKLTNGGAWAGAFGIFLFVLGFVGLGLLGVVAGIVLVVIAAFGRSTTYTVTYQR